MQQAASVSVPGSRTRWQKKRSSRLCSDNILSHIICVDIGRLYRHNREVNTNLIVHLPQIQLCFPEEALVYDYRLDDAGISNLKGDDEDEERKVGDTFFHTDLNATKYIFILGFTFIVFLHVL